MNYKNNIKMKNELIFLDQKALKEVNKNISDATGDLNRFVRMCIKTLGSLEPSQIEGLKSNALSVISDELKSRFMFPNASESFNLTALGLDPEPLYQYFRKHSGLWNSFKFSFDPDFLEFQPEEKQSQIDACYYFADTPERKRLIDLAKKTIELYDDLRKSKFIDSPAKFLDLFTTKLFTYKSLLKTDNDDSLIIDTKMIPTLFHRADRGDFAAN